jgi:membrane associated rhomboid family serine protease
MRPTWVDDRPRHQPNPWLPFGLESIPVTRALLVACGAVFVAFLFTEQFAGPLGKYLPFRSDGWVSRPWTLLTYALIDADFWVVLTLYVLYLYGGSLERAWGAAPYASAVAAFTLVGSISFGLAAVAVGRPVQLLGFGVPLAALVTAWAAMHPDLVCNVLGAPVKARWIAVGWLVLTYYQVAAGPIGPVVGVAVVAAPAVAWFYTRSRRGLSWRRPPAVDRWKPDLREDPPLRRREGPPEQIGGGLNPLRRRQEQREIERLRRLLGEDDDDDGRPAGRR